MLLPAAESSQIVRKGCAFDFFSNTMHPVTHIIFDMDGVLLGIVMRYISYFECFMNQLFINRFLNIIAITDTEKISKQSVAKVVAKFGKTYSLDLCFRILGAPELDGAKIVVDELKLPISIEEYMHMVREIKSKVMSDVDVLPGFYFFLLFILI